MSKNAVFAVIIVVVLVFSGVFLYKANSTPSSESPIKTPLSTQQDKEQDKGQKLNDFFSDLVKAEPVNILLLGIDRRHRSEAYRTDIMILATVDPNNNTVVLASVPRDLWWSNSRINALFPAQGWEDMQKAFEQITGVKPDHFIMTDFADFKWIVDAMGGVPVEIETTFTDESFPVDETFEYQTVHFTKGYEKLTGERALIFARSRKGDFDNGDWGRMKRQHLILKGFLQAVTQKESIFNPMVVEKAFELVTKGRMDTNLTLNDAKALWDMHKDYKKYSYNSMYLDYDYLYTPPAEEYGGAWVLAPKEGALDQFKAALKATMNRETTVAAPLE